MVALITTSLCLAFFGAIAIAVIGGGAGLLAGTWLLLTAIVILYYGREPARGDVAVGRGAAADEPKSGRTGGRQTVSSVEPLGSRYEIRAERAEAQRTADAA